MPKSYTVRVDDDRALDIERRAEKRMVQPGNFLRWLIYSALDALARKEAQEQQEKDDGSVQGP